MFCQGRFFAEYLELSEGSVMGSGEGGIVADEGGKPEAAEAEVVEGRYDAFIGGEVEAFQFLAAFEEIFVVEAGFDRGEAAVAPAGCGHDGDEFEFEGSLGLELVDVGVEEVFVVGLGFAGQYDLFGAEAVFAGVLSDLRFSSGGDGAGGFGCVGSVGGGLCLAHVSSRGG